MKPLTISGKDLGQSDRSSLKGANDIERLKFKYSFSPKSSR